MRTRLKRYLVMLAFFLIVGICVFVFWPAPRIGKVNFDKIQPGWTLAEVQALLGPGLSIDNTDTTWAWGGVVGDTIIVELDAHRRVTTKRLLPDNLTPLQRLYRGSRASLREALDLPPEP